MTFPVIPPPAEPAVVSVLRTYRQGMDAKEIQLMEEMGLYWLEIEKRLDADILALANEIKRRSEAGEVITQQIVWRAERYQILKAKLQIELEKYNLQASSIITRSQKEYATLGLQIANDAIASVFYEGGQLGTWTRINIDAVEAMIGLASDGSPLGKLLREDYPDTYNGLTNALVNGIARGLPVGQVAKEMADGMGIGLNRALLIARTETNKTYRMAAIEQYRKSGVVKGFKRLVKKETACMACLMLDGETFKLESELWDHPRGKCIAAPLIFGAKVPVWQSGEAYFNNLSKEEQIERMGPGKYELWQDGKIKLSDLAGYKQNKQWGPSPQVRTIKELLNE